MNIKQNNFSYTKKEIFTREEVADRYQCHVDTITSLVESKILSCIRIGKRYIFTLDSLHEFEKQYINMNLRNKLEMLESYRIVNNINK